MENSIHLQKLEAVDHVHVCTCKPNKGTNNTRSVHRSVRVTVEGDGVVNTQEVRTDLHLGMAPDSVGIDPIN